MLTWDSEHAAFRDEAREVLPLLLGATRVDWIQKYSMRTNAYLEQRSRLKLRAACAQMGPVILGHMSEPSIANAGDNVYCVNEPLMYELHQKRGWESWGSAGMDPDAVARLTEKSLEQRGLDIACHLLVEPLWDMLAGAGNKSRPRLSPSKAAACVIEWIRAVRSVDPSIPLVWSEAAVNPGPAGWTREAVL